MFYCINEMIESSLQVLFSSKNQSLAFSEFKDKKGAKIEKISEFFQIMEKKKLIKIEKDKCTLTQFGKEIVENGGWFEHLKKKKECEKIEIEEIKPEEIYKKTKKKKSNPFF